MKIDEKRLEEIEAALLRLDDNGFQIYPSSQKSVDDGYWSLWHDDNEITIDERGPYDEKKEAPTFEKARSRDQLLSFLAKNDVAMEHGWGDRQTDYEKACKAFDIFPLEEITFKVPRPLAQKFKKIILNDPEKLQKYVLDSVIEAIKDDAENFAYSE